MCGIAGYLDFSPYSETSPDRIAAMTAAMARRGPDSDGFHRFPNPLFGHRRLAIFDLSPAGHQPMLAAGGDVGIVFNGSIYNFLSLKEDLEARGHRFRSRCDTEVLLEGYLAWGIHDLVRRLRGMFAFALWDRRSQQLFLVRDRLGVKPLLYQHTRDGLAFASTLGALAAAGYGGSIDPAAVLEFLEFGYVTDQRAILRGISKVPAATIVEWKDGNLQHHSYWSLPEPTEDSSRSFTDAVDRTEDLILESVRLRLFADVPVGVLLSGGIDSSLVCWAMAEAKANIHAFTVATPGDPADESEAAASTARSLGIPHRIVSLPTSEPPSLEELSSAYSEPFACSSALGMLRVCRAVKPLATVLLTGDGGDDVFLGYPFHKHFLLAQRLGKTLPQAVSRLWPHLRGFFPEALRRPRHFLDYATGGIGAATRVFDGLPYYQNAGMLGEALESLSLPQRQIPLSPQSGRAVLADYLRYELKTRFTGEFMTKVDGASMHYAIEARAPFLDHLLWEFAAQLPFSLRLYNGELKAILRAIARRRISPDAASRPKQGFTIPVQRWLATHWRTSLEQTLTPDSLLVLNRWIRPQALQRSLQLAFSRQYVPTQLFYLLVLENWLRKQTAGQLAALPASRM